MNYLQRHSIHTEIDYLYEKDLYNQQPVSIPSAARLKIDLNVLWLGVTASLKKNQPSWYFLSLCNRPYVKELILRNFHLDTSNVKGKDFQDWLLDLLKKL